jgi:hypothetical protein
MIVLVGGDDEERVLLGDPAVGETGEELAERLVEGGERLDIAGLTRPEECHFVGIYPGQRLLVVVVGILDIAGDDRDAGLQHRREIAQGLRRRRVKAGKTRIAVAVGDDVAV